MQLFIQSIYDFLPLSVVAPALFLLYFYLKLCEIKTNRLQNPAKEAVASIAAAVNEIETSRAATYMPFALHHVLFDASCQSHDLSARVLTIKNQAQRTEIIRRCAAIVDGIRAAAARAMTAEERAADNKILAERLAKVEARAINMLSHIEKEHRTELERHARRVQRQREEIIEDQERLARFDAA